MSGQFALCGVQGWAGEHFKGIWRATKFFLVRKGPSGTALKVRDTYDSVSCDVVSDLLSSATTAQAISSGSCKLVRRLLIGNIDLGAEVSMLEQKNIDNVRNVKPTAVKGYQACSRYDLEPRAD